MSGPTPLRVLPNLRDRTCWARALDNRIRRRWAPPRIEVGLLDPREGDVVADLGAGPGYFDPEILGRIGRAGRLYLVDIDPENLEFAKQRLSSDPRVTVLAGSAAQIPSIPGSSVDRVLLSLVLCCLWDKSGALSEAWRILRPGGTAVVTYPRRGPISRMRKRTLAVSGAAWRALLGERPWTVTREAPGWWAVRHVLVKPIGSGVGPAGSEAAVNAPGAARTSAGTDPGSPGSR